MKTKTEEQSVEEEWRAAEAALADAQKMPGGPERIEALKKAGQLANFDTRPTSEGARWRNKEIE
jgi:hypothetical protein